MESPTARSAAITPERPVEKPPVAPRRPFRRTLHGVALQDDYAWLKDANWQQVLRNPALLDADIRSYLEAENRYTASILAPTETLQKTLVAEMRGRIKEDDASVPQPDGPFAYLWRYRDGGQHELIGRTPRDGGEAEILLDGDALAKASDYFNFGDTRHSPDHRLEAWSADLRGSEYFTLRVRRWQGGEDLTDIVEQTSGNVVWGLDSTFFLYVRQDENHRPLKVYRHRLGTAQADDVLVYEEKDSGWFTRVEESSSGRFAIVATGNQETSERWLIDLSQPDSAPRLVAARETGVRYTVFDRGEELFILTNQGDAIDFRIATAPLATPDRSHWRPLIPHRPGTYIITMALYAGHLVRLERANALPSIVIRDLADGAEHVIDFAESAYALDIIDGYEFDTTTLRFAYSSMTTPAETYDYDMRSRERSLRKRQQIPSGHDPAAYVTTRLMVPSHDGAEVPVSILHRRDFKRDGARTAPALRLRLLWHGDAGVVLGQSPVAGRPGLRLCHRPCARRLGQGLGLVSRRQAREEDEHVRRFRRRGARADRRQIHLGQAHRRPRRQRRRHADGRRRQPGGRALRRHRLRGAFRRRAEHDARRHLAADAARMARMGQPDHRRERRSATSSPTRPTTMSPPRTIPRSWPWPA